VEKATKIHLKSLLEFLPTITAISWPPPWISHLFSQWRSWGLHTLGCFGLDTLYENNFQLSNAAYKQYLLLLTLSAAQPTGGHQERTG